MMPPNMPPQMPPQPPDPEKMKLMDEPTWEEVFNLIRNNQRMYRIDIETDSTIAAQLDNDLQGIDQVVTGIFKAFGEMGPAIQSGMLPLEAGKEILMSVVRRARLGLAVEDALDKMQPPKPPQDPKVGIEQQKIQAEQQRMQMQAQIDEKAKQQDLMIDQARMQMEERLEMQRQEREMQVETHRQEMQAQEVAHQNQLEAQRIAMQAELDAKLEAQRIAADERMAAQDAKLELLIAQMNNAAKITVAEIGKEGGLLQAEMANAAREASDDKLVD